MHVRLSYVMYSFGWSVSDIMNAVRDKLCWYVATVIATTIWHKNFTWYLILRFYS